MDQWAEREAIQQTNSVGFTDLGSTDARTGRAVGYAEESGGGGGGGGVSGGGGGGVRRRVYCPYFLSRARAEPLQQPAQDHPIFEGGLQEGFGIRDGLLRRLQYPERNQPRNRLFRRIHVQSQQILFNKAPVFGVFWTAQRLGYAVICALE